MIITNVILSGLAFEKKIPFYVIDVKTSYLQLKRYTFFAFIVI